MSNPTLEEVRSGADLTTTLTVDGKTYKVKRTATIRDRIELGVAMAQARGGLAPDQVDVLTAGLAEAAVTLRLNVLEPKDFDPFAADVNDEHLQKLWKEYLEWTHRFRVAPDRPSGSPGREEAVVPGAGGEGGQ